METAFLITLAVVVLIILQSNVATGNQIRIHILLLFGITVAQVDNDYFGCLSSMLPKRQSGGITFCKIEKSATKSQKVNMKIKRLIISLCGFPLYKATKGFCDFRTTILLQTNLLLFLHCIKYINLIIK